MPGEDSGCDSDAATSNTKPIVHTNRNNIHNAT